MGEDIKKKVKNEDIPFDGTNEEGLEKEDFVKVTGASFLSIRMKPSINSTRRGVVDKDEKMKVLAVLGDWVKVEINNEVSEESYQGYAMAEYLEEA